MVSSRTPACLEKPDVVATPPPSWAGAVLPGGCGRPARPPPALPATHLPFRWRGPSTAGLRGSAAPRPQPNSQGGNPFRPPGRQCTSPSGEGFLEASTRPPGLLPQIFLLLVLPCVPWLWLPLSPGGAPGSSASLWWPSPPPTSSRAGPSLSLSRSLNLSRARSLRVCFPSLLLPAPGHLSLCELRPSPGPVTATPRTCGDVTGTLVLSCSAQHHPPPRPRHAHLLWELLPARAPPPPGTHGVHCVSEM